MRIWQTVVNFIRKSILATNGDLMSFGGGVLYRLPSAGANRVLRSTGVGTALSWVLNQVFSDNAGTGYRTLILDIGAWDMDATNLVQINHGLTLSNIVSVSGVIYNDAGTFSYLISEGQSTVGVAPDVWIPLVSPTQVYIDRQGAGIFNDPAFDDAVMNRGKLLITFTT